MEYNRVINGIIKYLNREIMPQLNNWQEILARVVVARFKNNSETIKNLLTDNPFLSTFAIIDQDGIVDVMGLISDLKTAINEKGCIEFELPVFGKFKFSENDIETLHLCIKES